MLKYDFDEVRTCYRETAREYHEEFKNELDGKPFDREILARFAASLAPEDRVVEFGAGSGHVSKFLYDRGLRNLTATDISEPSLEIGRSAYPMIRFEYADMTATAYDDRSIDGIVCFYGIVHFTYKEIGEALAEWKRILKMGGKALFSFHVGEDESIRIDKFLGKEKAKATWNLFKADAVLDVMHDEGIAYEEAVIRYPYIGLEHPSRRCYILWTNA